MSMVKVATGAQPSRARRALQGAFWLLAVISAQAAAGAAQPPADAWETFKQPGPFITALSASDQALWIATEDAGLWRLDLSADPAKPGAWRQFTTKEGLASDDVYAIAVDAAGRVWAGTLDQGVSVYNGREWRTFGVYDGCSGERVFGLAADPDPARGSVWIATDHGLTSWTPTPDGKGAWRTWTQADGLPASQVYAVAVGPAGRVWIGTECDGLAWSDPPYDKWQCVRAEVERSGDATDASGVGEKGAPGLPSNLINAVRVLAGGTVVASTDFGLGISRDGGRTWTAWQGLAKKPYENYARGLAEDGAGGLWIATRHKGLARLDLKTEDLKCWQQSAARKPPPRPLVPDGAVDDGVRPDVESVPVAPPADAGDLAGIPDDYVFDVAVTPGAVWVGTYGGGLARLTPASAGVGARKAATVPAGAKAAAVRLPEPLGAPTLAELHALLAALGKVPFVPPVEQPPVVRLDDDWLTKGDCLGRYGRYWGCWCAICSPKDYVWGAGPERVEYAARIGPKWARRDSIRYWVQWLYTGNPGSLEMPPTYLDSRIKKGYQTADFTRREAEWCDNGHAYPMSDDGPSLYCSLRIPEGLFYLSLYDHNKDGHSGLNRFRDYRISVRRHVPGPPPAAEVGENSPDDLRNFNLYDVSGFDQQQEMARGRIRDFWGGVYKRFLVRGPIEITVCVNRNHSHNTMLEGVFLDLVDERPVPYFHTLAEWRTLQQARAEEQKALEAEAASGARAERFRAAASEDEAASRLFEELGRMPLVNAVWWAQESRPFYAAVLRWAVPRMASAEDDDAKNRFARIAATCCYQLGLYEEWDDGQAQIGVRSARRIEKALRWDGVTYSYQGKGYEIVTKYLLERRRREQGNRDEISVP
ncbi:MAG TPA: two-component regulator propeller domain-containing protein [Phycisphaerae bacterium]|nr:two-component regulator propeller domain-containing protein [Phycisphaerae bacterium]